MKGLVFAVIVYLLLACHIAKADFFFGETTVVKAPINDGFTAFAASMSADGLTLYYDSWRDVPGFDGVNIWVAIRTTIEDDWSTTTPMPLGDAVNSQAIDLCPRISADGLELYYTSYREGGAGASDIYVTRRQSIGDLWEAAENLGETLNSAEHDYVGSLSPDGLVLYYTAGSTLQVATRETKHSPWLPTTFPGPVADRQSPAISPNGLHLAFSSNSLPGGLGLEDLWMLTRATIATAWSDPIPLDLPLNSSVSDGRPWISYDGATILFTAGHPFTGTRPGGIGGADIWQAPILPLVDFTGDSKVDIKDQIKITEHWGQNKSSFDIGPIPFGDGIVDAADMDVLMDYWEQEVYDPWLIAHWKLDETEGNVAYDSVRENHAVLVGDTTWLPEGGQIAGALQFDGLDDYMHALQALNPAGGPFSVFAWIKGGAPGQTVISQENGVNWLMADAEGGALRTDISDPITQSRRGLTGGLPLISTTLITDGNWHRIGFVWDGLNRLLYVDDVVVAEDTLSELAGVFSGLLVGTSNSLEAGTFWSGLIDDVRIFDRVVTP